METWVDNIGNVHGRVGGINSSAAVLLIGSHYDTVIDGGRCRGLVPIDSIPVVNALRCQPYFRSADLYC